MATTLKDPLLASDASSEDLEAQVKPVPQIVYYREEDDEVRWVR